MKETHHPQISDQERRPSLMDGLLTSSLELSLPLRRADWNEVMVVHGLSVHCRNDHSGVGGVK